ncbi:MAG TPA: nuclear transport factor 2 family protein [Steroidobacteraceae bacterium]|nr:nuclear transport factor 2 family protein [Steroidobacteraceae bacterium]
MELEEEIKQIRRTLQYLKDRQDILDCITRESRGRDRHDAALTASCYWEDGADEHGRALTPGPQYGEQANSGHRAGFSANSHNLTNHTCEIEGDVAHCETYVVGGLLSLDQATCKIALGRYVDRLERRNGEWKIKLRRTVIDMVAEGDASWLRSPAIAGFLKGVRSKEDPSYRRPNRLDPADARW